MHQSTIKISGNDIAYYDTKSGNQAVLFIPVMVLNNQQLIIIKNIIFYER